MDAPAGPSASWAGRQALFGLAVEDPRLAQLARRVLFLSILSAALTFLPGLVVPGSQSPAWVASGLLVPCCGYWGAKRGNATLTWCFCACSLLNAVGAIVLLVVMLLEVLAIGAIVDNCDPLHPNHHVQCPTQDQWARLCPQGDLTAEQCYQKLGQRVNIL